MNKNETTYVYIVSSLEDGVAVAPVKIGVANDPRSRLKTFRTASPNPICLTMFFGPMSRGDALLEQMAHEACSRFRRNGEWFNLDPYIGIDVVGNCTNLVCIGVERDPVRFAKLSSKLGVAAANMLREPT